MRKSICAIVACGALAWSSAVWAVAKTDVTVSNNLSETASATIMIEQLDKSGKKLTSKTTRIHLSKARPSRHQTVAIDEKKTSTINMVVIYQKAGKTVEETHSVPVADFIDHGFNLGHGLTLQNSSGGVPSNRTASGQPSSPAVPYLPEAPFPTGLYVVAIAGGANNCTDQTFIQIISLGGADAFDPDQRSACGTSFVYGGAVGANFDTPFISPFINSPIQAGAEVSILGSSGGSGTFQGTPTTLLGPSPGSDTFTAKDNYFIVINGTLTVPVTPTLSIFGKAGYGWANKTFTYNCSGFCDLAGTPQYSQSKDVTLGGPAVGGGVSWKVQYDQQRKEHFVTLEFDYEHIFLNDKTVQFGDPATIFNSSRIGQDVDLFTARVVVPVSAFSRGFDFKSNWQTAPVENKPVYRY
jgi:opacity protein-like surface antigen